MIDDRAVEAAARAMEPRCFEIFDAGYAPLNWFEERAFLNAEKVVKRARKKARAALTAAAPFLTQIPDGWKTIDTAPKDGTRILIWHGNIEIARWADLNVSFATRYGWRDDCSEFREVTHWQPLPLPPPTEKNDG